MKSSTRLNWLLALWGLAAGAAGAVHLLAHLPGAGPQILVASLTISLSVAVMRVGWLRDAVKKVSARKILGLHVLRVVPGAWFLWLYAQGRMPVEFAERAGWGDIIAGLGATGLLFWPEGVGFRRAARLWNIFALADLIVAVGTAGWLNATRPGAMVEISSLPLALIPLWLVPMLVATHILLFRRLGCAASDATSAAENPV
jgi:hypothetical protein